MRDRGDWARVVLSVYDEVDVPPPSQIFPVAPLAPVLERFAISCVELPGLTAGVAETFLTRRRVLREPLSILARNRDEPLSGFLYAVGDMAFLFVNQNDSVTRRRFSVAHELGHLFLHFRPALQNWRESVRDSPEAFRPGLFDGFNPASSGGDGEDDSNLEAREREANAFAAHLLVPEDILRMRQDALTARSNVARQDRLATDFLVSGAVMRQRLEALRKKEGDISCAIH